ncbi:hypothetical protein DM02DRAFT_546563, partial [Periconia macrospinosa]
LLDYLLSNNKYSSALISAIAVIGINANSRWISLLLYTLKQAAIINILRILVLYRAI